MQACRVLDLSRSSYYYKPTLAPEQELMRLLKECHEEHDSGGFYQLFHRLKHQGVPDGRPRMLQAYHKLNLSISRRKTKKKPKRERVEREAPTKPNEVWAMDFLTDQLEDGTSYRVLSVIDEYTREVLLSFVGSSIKSKKVLDLLDLVMEQYGKPEALRSDNGSDGAGLPVHCRCRPQVEGGQGRGMVPHTAREARTKPLCGKIQWNA